MSPSPKAEPASHSFEDLGLAPSLLEVLSNLGYEEPTPIQREAVPLLLEGRDVLGQAATGTGKTAAFALPMIQRLEPGQASPFHTTALVLVPTRELAVQVAEAVHTYGKGLGVSVLPIYGGQEFSRQLTRLKRGVDVVVATPGRALDHLRRKTLKLEDVAFVVLDEADEMLDLGFAEDLDAILSEVPEGAQRALFSATLPPRIAGIAEQHLDNPVRLKIRQEKAAAGTAPKVRQTAYIVPRSQKPAALGRVLDLEAPRNAIIFCRTRTEVEEVADRLSGTGYQAEALHGGMTQAQRDRVLKRFKAGTSELLIATDVAARGLHVEKLSHVFNYDLPTAPEAYVHRIGRTGRAGQEGVAISFAEPREHRLLKNIERVTGQRIEAAVLPTIADLRARKLDVAKASIRETIVAGELERYRSVVEALAAEFDVMDIAAAAVKLSQAQEEGEPETGEDELDRQLRAAAERERPERKGRFDRGEERGRGERFAREEPRGERAPRAGRYAEAPQQERREWGTRAERPSRAAAGGRRGAPAGGPFVRVFVSLGRNAGVRPADLVGAIANEADVESRNIGAIQIADAYSLVEVPEPDADRVVKALRATTLRGRKVKAHTAKS